MDFDVDAFNYTISHNITSREGLHEYIVFCNSSIIGGFRTTQFEITESGKKFNENNQQQWIIIFSFLVATMLLILALWKQDVAMAMLSGFLFIASGVFIAINGFAELDNFMSQAISLILIGFGAYIALKASGESAENELNLWR